MFPSTIKIVGFHNAKFMITVKYDNPIGLIRERQCIFVSFPYKASIVQVLRGFYSRRWHQDKKCWELPYDCMSELKYLLPNEKFNIIGEPCDTKKYREKELDLNIPLPECKTTPFNYQKDVYAEAMNFNKYILNLEMGTGKSMISLLAMKKRMELGQIKRCLIIPCVASLKYNWQEEIRKHLGEESLVLGSRRNRKGRWSVKSNAEKLADLENLPQGSKWLITNVESFRDKNIKEAVKKLIKKGEIDALIIDEVHKLVSPRAQQTKAILSLAPLIPYTLLLTGTILLNRPTDLFVPLKLIDAETKSFTVFKNFYCIMGGYGGYQIVGYKHLDELQHRLSEVSVRVRKEDVLDLPDKLFVEEYLEMENKQTKIYQQVLESIVADIDKVVLNPNPLAQMIRLRQATADTSILSDSVAESVKFDRAESLIEDIVANGDSVLVFSNWSEVIDNLEARLTDKFSVAKITGKVTDVEAQKEKFNKDDCHILLMTTKAGGTGHTFNKATYIIFLDEPWTSADLQQAVARCHRIGQTKPVTIYTLMCKDTIDEYIHRIVKRKGALGDSIVDAKYNLKNTAVVNYLLTGEGNIEGE